MLSVIMLLGMLSLTAGCSGVKISDIQANPGQYEGKEVNISGTVNETYWLGLLKAGAYQINDGTGAIWVSTNQTPPDKGTKASVKGTVTSALKIGDKSLGIAITEISRK